LRYNILQFHAKGGMGQVWVAQDSELDREVALKEIQPQFSGDEESQRRFILEARVTGRLEHPGIVPVYGLGRYGDGRPFYAMRFIKGESLKEAIERFHQLVDPGQRSLELHKLLQHLVNTCNAIAYAHSRGVLHRDLKPGNVMLGQYGETLVVDWGLAVPVAPADRTAAAAQPSMFPDDTVVREDGALRGTLQYMSPEQSTGELERMGPPSDVYSLGAILYAILTNRERFESSDVNTFLDRLERGEFPPPRQVKADVPRALEAVCLKALALQPEQRYATPLDLARDLEKWMADEPVSAWREPWPMRARRWIARHRTLVTAGSTAAVVLLISLTAVALLVRAAQHREEVRLAKIHTEAQRLVVAGRAASQVRDWQNANLALSSALAQLGDEPALADLKEEARQLHAQTTQALAELAARQQALQHYERFIQQRNEALFHYGTLYTSLDFRANIQAARKAIQEALDLAGAAVDGTGPIVWTQPYTDQEKAAIAEGCYELLLILAEVVAQDAAPADEGKTRQALQDAFRILDRAAQLGGVSRAYHLRRARYFQQLGDGEQSRVETERAQRLVPIGAAGYFLLGDEWFRRGGSPETIKAFENSLRRRPDRFWAQFFLAQYYLQKKRLPEAKAWLTACLAQRPDFPWLYVLRGMILARQEEFELAETDFEQAQRRNPSPEASYLLLVYRGGMRGKQGNFAEAIADLRKAQAAVPHLHDAPEALVHVYLRANRLAEAAALLEEAIQRWPKVASLYALRARLALARGDCQAAVRDCQAALRLQAPAAIDGVLADELATFAATAIGKLKVSDAADAAAAALRLRPDHVNACLAQLWALQHLGKHAEAIDVSNRFLENGPAFADIFRLRGWSRAQRGDHAGAVDDYSRFLLAGPGLAAGKLGPEAAAREAEVLAQRGWAYAECNAWSMALRDFQQVLQLQPDNDRVLIGRALAHGYLGDYRAAAADAEAALRGAPKLSLRNYNAARAHALAAARAAMDAKEPARERLAAGYRRRALELLAAAMTLLPEEGRAAYWRNKVQADPSLDSIRGEPDYHKLAAQYAAASP